MAVFLAKLNDSVFSEYCEKYGISRTDTVETDIKLFKAKVLQVVSKNKLVTCEDCGMISSLDDDCCPFCGASDAPSNKASEMAVVSVSKKLEPVIVTSKMKKAGPMKSKAKAAEVLMQSLEPVMSSMTDSDFQTSMVSDSSTELAIRAEEMVVKSSTLTDPTTINDAIECVKQAKELACVCHYQLGRSILNCFKNDLWKQLNDEDGNPKYTNFYRFCENELSLSGRYCHSLMSVAASFSSEDVRGIGVAKLNLVLRSPEGERDKLLLDVRQGIPYTDLAAKVKELNNQSFNSRAGIPLISPSESDPTKAVRSNVIVDPVMVAPSIIERVITCTHVETRVHIPLFCAGDENHFYDEGNTPLKRATRLADDPWGEEMSANGVRVRYTLVCNCKNEIELIVERRRLSDD